MRIGRVDISFGSVAAIGLLVLGLWVVPWFAAEADADTSADATPLGALAAGADRTVSPNTQVGSMRIKLYSTEVCHDRGTICGSAMTSKTVDGLSGWLALATLGAGTLFGLLLLESDSRRMVGHDGSWWRITVGGVVGVAALGCALTCLATFAPGGIAYVIHESPSQWNQWHTKDYEGVTNEPTRSPGGFAAMAGVLLGLGMMWRTRPERDVETQPDVPETTAAVEPRRAPLEGPPRGVETDPFRAPPAPPPVAVVRPTLDTTAPRAERDDNTPGPTLLR